VEKYLFWFNGEYIGVKEKLTDALEYGSSRDDRYFIQITNHCDTQYLKYVIKSDHIPEKNGFGKVLNVFPNKENPKLKDTILNEDFIIDTGCTTSLLPSKNFKNFLI
jgi:hypothetical protein